MKAGSLTNTLQHVNYILTGGAGKSILLDSLGFVLGWRGRAELVRSGAEQGEVQAVFDLPPHHPARAVLQDAGLPEEDIIKFVDMFACLQLTVYIVICDSNDSICTISYYTRRLCSFTAISTQLYVYCFK